jgi:hypothetical protein
MSGLVVDLGKQVTSRLGLLPIQDEKKNYLYNGLCPAVMTGISLHSTLFQKGEFEGKTLVALRFDFQNYKLIVDDPDRFLTIDKRIVGTQEKVDPNREDSPYKPRLVEDIVKDGTATISFIIHMIESLHKSPNFKPLSQMPAADLALFNNIPIESSVSIDERVAYWNNLLTVLYKWVAGVDGKAMWLDAAGQPLKFWVKLTPAFPSKKWFSLNKYIGHGLLEPMVLDPNGAPKLAKILAYADLAELKLSGSTKVNAGSQLQPIPGQAMSVEQLIAIGQQ